jgi:hypothetical protein
MGVARRSTERAGASPRSIKPGLAYVVLVSAILCPSGFAQNNVVSLGTAKTVTAKIGETAAVPLSIKVTPGYHVNSNTPADPLFIPLRLTWNPGPLETVEIVFPEPQIEKYGFSEKPLSVFSGDFKIVTKFKVASSAVPGVGVLTGTLHYQACNDKMCLIPKTVEVTLPIEIVK